MTKPLFSLACLLVLTACQSTSPFNGEPMTPSARSAPAPLTPESVAPPGAMTPPDAGLTEPMTAPK
jgi:hypothetical protein